MGFESGFEKIKKADNCTFKEVLKALSFIEYENNDWAKKNYLTFEEFLIGSNEDKFFENVELREDLINFYKNLETDNIDFWCSSGRIFDSDILEFMNNTYSDMEYYLIDKDILYKLNKYIEIRNKDFKFKQIFPTMAIKEIEDDSFILKPIEGIQYEDENGNIGQYLGDGFDNIPLFSFESNAVDLEDYYTINSLHDTIIKLNNIDLDKYFVWYYRSY